MRQTDCPCGNKKPYSECCKPFHRGDKLAQTAQQLMRSRYTAFYYGKDNPAMIDYLLGTHHPSQHKPDEREGIAETARQLQWLGLTILNTEAGQVNDKQGVVEFVAYHQSQEGHKGQHHERSRFLKENGRWFYVDGDIMPTH